MEKKDAVLLFTGHLIDSIDRVESRFPQANLDEAARLLRLYLEQAFRNQTFTLAVSSLGAGADMLFASEMLERNVPLVIFLPFDKETFIAASVEYRKSHVDDRSENWRLEFDRIVAQATEVIYLDQQNTGGQAFAYCNERMLAFAQSRGRLISAIAMMKPGEAEKEGGSAHFASIIKRQGIQLQVVWPFAERADVSLVNKLEKIIPLFKKLDASASYYQNRWKRRLKISLMILAVIAFFDAFVTVPDHFLFGHGQAVRIVSLLFSVAGAFLTLQLQVSDKTSLRQWTNSRAKAEQIRSEVWYYLFNYWSENNRFGPYTESEFELYIQRLSAAHGPVFDLASLIHLKQTVIQLSVQEKTNFYVACRLKDQLSYFKKKKEYFTGRLRIYKLVTFVFLGISISWGTLKMLAEFNLAPAFFLDMSPTGMMISFIALVSSFAEANNSKEMEYKYEQMAGGLALLQSKRQHVETANDFDLWVRECETFLRAQNNEWSLKREK